MKSNEKRKVEIKKGDVWEQRTFSDIKDGDIFRLYEHGETQLVSYNGVSEFEAVGEPFKNDNGILTIKTTWQG